MSNRAALYLRVSSKAQAGEDHVSLTVQLRDCTAFCEQHGWTVVATEEDHETGRAVTRKGYVRLLELARAGQLDHIVVWEPTRFGRKAWEVLARVEEMQEIGVTVHSVTKRMDDWLSMAVNAIVAENEWRTLAARSVSAKRHKAAEGRWLGHAPFGTVSEKGILKPGPHFDKVQLAFQLCMEGVPTREITRRLNAEMHPESISHPGVRKLLTNPVYAGIVRWAGKESTALWPAMIPPEMFAAAGEALKLRYRERKRIGVSAPYWILGLAFCGHCGSRLYPKVETKPWGTIYAYLLCGLRDQAQMRRGCGAFSSIDLMDVQSHVLDELRDLRLDVADGLARLEQAEQALYNEAEAQRRALERERSRISDRITQTEQGYLDKVFSAERTIAIRQSLNDQIAAIDRDLAAIAMPAPSNTYAAIRAFLEDDRAMDAIASEGPEAFREIARHLIEDVLVYGKGEYRVRLASVFAERGTE